MWEFVPSFRRLIVMPQSFWADKLLLSESDENMNLNGMPLPRASSSFGDGDLDSNDYVPPLGLQLLSSVSTHSVVCRLSSSTEFRISCCSRRLFRTTT